MGLNAMWKKRNTLWLMGVVEAPSPSGIPSAPSTVEVVRAAVLSKKRKSHLDSHAARIRPKQTKYKFQLYASANVDRVKTRSFHAFTLLASTRGLCLARRL